MNMTVSASSSASQSTQSNIATLQKDEQKLLNQIKQLQSQDAAKNAKQIQSLQQQAQQIEMQIMQQQAQSQNSGTSQNTVPSPAADPAYTVQLGQQSNQALTSEPNNIAK